MSNVVETFIKTDASQTLSEFNKLERKTKEAGGAFNRFGEQAEKGMSRATRAVALFKSKMEDGIDAMTKKFEKGMKRGLQGAALAGTVYAGLSARNFLEFDKGATITATVALDDSPAAMGKLRQQVLGLSKELGVDTSDIWESEYDIFSSVIDRLKNNDDSIILAKKIAKGAQTANASMKDFGSGVMGVMNTYKMGVEQVDHITDVFFQTLADGANTTGQQLSMYFGKINKSGSAVGATFEEIAAAAAYVTKNGGEAEENMTALDNLFNQMARANIAGNAKALGINFFDAKGMRRAWIDVIGDIKKKMDTLGTQEKKMQFLDVLFGGGGDIRAMRGFYSIISNYEELRKASVRYKEATGVTEKAFQKFQVSTGYNIHILSNKIKLFGMESLEAINPLLNLLARGEKDSMKLYEAWQQSVENLERINPTLASMFKWGSRFISLFTGSDMDTTLRKLENLAMIMGSIYLLIKAAQAYKWWQDLGASRKIGKGGVLGGATGVMNVTAGVVNINGTGGAAGGAAEGAAGAEGAGAAKAGKYAGAWTLFKGASIPAAALVIQSLMEAQGESVKDWAKRASNADLWNAASRQSVMGVAGTRNVFMQEWDKRNRVQSPNLLLSPSVNAVINQDQPIYLNGTEIGRIQGQYTVPAGKTIVASPSTGMSSEIPMTVPVGVETLK